ncbi:hypothetical protein HIC20_02890 [Buchnera aphidicola (Hormaphis cornu)]|nr:hypothetical protein HIC20_02890 [Buchnera aphidicola (Hormaphis cornu)]
MFLDKQKEPSVGIILELQKGRMLSFGQVQSIVHLVSCSISDLKESNITIIDQYGHLLNQSGKEYDDLHNLRYRYCNELEHTFFS